MNTGPIIGGTRDGEQHSHNDKFCVIPAPTRLLPSPSMSPMIGPDDIVWDREQLRWVPFYFHSPDRDITTGFWVSMCNETRNLLTDAEFRVYVLMKLSERYIEYTKAIEKRLIDRLDAGL